VRSLKVDERALEEEREIYAHPRFGAQLIPIAELIGALRAARTAEDFYRLHRVLFGRFLGVQAFIREAGREKRTARQRVAELSAERPLPCESLRRLNLRIGELDGDLRCARAVISLYRTIGDAIVWVILGCRRELIAPLGEGERVGWLAEGRGLEAEFEEIEWLWTERNVFTLHADLTNCVRHGDLLEVTSFTPRQVRLTEVKAGRAPDPNSKQMQRLARLSQLVNEGSYPGGPSGEPLILRRCPVAHRTHQAVLEEALVAASAETYVARVPEQGLLIEVYDSSDPAELGQAGAEARSEPARQAALGPDEDAALVYSTTHRRIRDRHQTFSSQLPLALLPLRIDLLCELLLGRFDVVVSLDPAVLERRIAEAGLGAEIARGEEAGDRFMRLHSERAQITVPAPTREQVLIELTTLDCLTETLAWFIADAESGGFDRPAVALGNLDERSTWMAGFALP